MNKAKSVGSAPVSSSETSAENHIDALNFQAALRKLDRIGAEVVYQRWSEPAFVDSPWRCTISGKYANLKIEAEFRGLTAEEAFSKCWNVIGNWVDEIIDDTDHKHTLEKAAKQ